MHKKLTQRFKANITQLSTDPETEEGEAETEATDFTAEGEAVQLFRRQSAVVRPDGDPRDVVQLLRDAVPRVVRRR